MTQFLKINSKQGGPFTVKNNLIDFEIPEDVYDFSKSYVNVYATIDVDEVLPTAADDDGIVGIHPFGITDEAQTITEADNIYNIAFVRNCSLKGRKVGRIEDIRRVDILKQNLNEFTLTEDEKDSISLNNTLLVRQRSGNTYSINCDLYGLGTTKSRYLTFPLKIPMSQLFETGVISQFPVNQTGALTVHLEMTNQLVRCIPLFYTDSGDNAPNNYFQDVDDIDDVGDVKSLVITNPIFRLDDVPYWVGQKLEIKATKGGTNVDVYRTIDSIELNQVSNKLKMTLNFVNTIDTLTSGEKLEDITLYFTGQRTSGTFQFQYAEMVLHKVLNPTIGSLDMLTYRTFTTEEQLVNQLSNYKRMFEMEPEAVNVLFMFAKYPNRVTSHAGDNINSIASYRVSQDNVDNTDRDVVMFSPLYKDRLLMSFTNMSKALKNLTNYSKFIFNPIQVLRRDQISKNQQLDVIAEPLTQTDNIKLVQLQIQTDGNNSFQNVPLFIYKQVQKSIKLPK
jgi:hypothetical protein